MSSHQQLVDRGIQVLNATGIGVLGMAAPMLSTKWAEDESDPSFTISENKNEMTLESGTFWSAPIAGFVQKIRSNSTHPKTLIKPNGDALTAQGILLTVHPHAYLRLSRVFAKVFESQNNAGTDEEQNLSIRPVPKHFFFEGLVFSGDGSHSSGNIQAGDSMDISGPLRIFDQNGFPIDPLFVLESFYQILNLHNVLQARSILDAPVLMNTTQLHRLRENLLPIDTAKQFVRLSEFSGAPYSGTHLSGFSTGASSIAAIGLFELDTTSGNTSIELDPSAETFPESRRRLFQFGLSTFSTLSQSFTPPSVPAGITLRRDFFDIRVVELEKFIIGTPNSDDVGTQSELSPEVRLNEQLQLLTDGNDVLASANAALSGTTIESLCVAQSIESDFSAPQTAGLTARWPQFPGNSEAPGTATAGPLSINLSDSFNPIAAYFDNGNTQTANVDIVLDLQNLPFNAAVYAFPRRFLPDARILRGDGAGGVVRADGGITLLFQDPFQLRRQGVTDSTILIPAKAVLIVDVIIVKRTQEHRMYSYVSAAVGPAQTATIDNIGTNVFNSTTRRGISNAGVLGLGSSVSLSTDNIIDTIIALTGETQPRDASRMPTMARRELMVASLQSGQWSSVLSAGRLSAEILSGNSKLASPGKLSGRESSTVGISTSGGQLAYDLGRSAFRRTTNIVERLQPLSTNNWAVPTALATDSPDAGTFAGAVLQNLAPACDTPELNIIKSSINPADIPETFDEFVDWLNDIIENVLPSGTPQRVRIINELNTRLDNLKDDNSLATSDKERLYNEIRREVMTSAYGRRDSQWALKNAIEQANHFIYIESPAFAATQIEYVSPKVTPNYAVDLIKTISERIEEKSGLHVIICTPKHLDYSTEYAPFAAHEVNERFEKIRNMSTADSRSSRVTAFHPIGFPGRPITLQSQTVIVDDIFALVGASTFRRRGLTFDGSTDIAFTDLKLHNGKSLAITQFRRAIMAERLGIKITSAGEISNPNFARLKDGVESFHLVREILLAGGFNKISPLWNGTTPGVTKLPTDSVSQAVANPDGREFNFLEPLVVSLLTNLAL